MLEIEKKVQVNAGISPQVLSTYTKGNEKSKFVMVCNGNEPVAVVVDYKTFKRMIVKEIADRIIDDHRHVLEELAK